MIINLRHLQCALEIQEKGTIQAAAKQIHLTQSALTQGINKLEDELKLRLFERTNSGMFATVGGARFLQRVSRAFDHLHDFAAALFSSDKIKKYQFVRSVTSRQLIALISICEVKSYTAAAKNLGLTQPTLHRAIKDLETLSALKLFTRSPTGVEPSWRARQLSRYASLFFVELHQGMEEIAEARGQMDGRLRIGCLPLALGNIVPECVLNLLADYPKAQISIVDGPYEEQLQGLLNGQLDVIIGALRSQLPHKDIIQQKLFNDELSIVVKADHDFAKRSTLSDIELQSLAWVVPSKGVPARQVFDDLFAQRGLPQPSAIIECSAMAAIRGLLMHSERAALLPARQVVAEVKSGQLAVCPLPLKGTKREIGLTTRLNWQPTRIQQQFLTILHTHCTGLKDTMSLN
ncbi:LysR family transcriptional regulator [Rheinheimera sp. UJ63]|uniref:LysR family transcriptional regulator n=1 Tax=Rheinheimera sp. UJ63 TaxID=2910157 RepID=UPI001F3EAACA|nr:LysR family transcriptional regulator [Rheinheimera sp. UJ63]MCF4010031.1 LysR family transcriptional regulator [Rheinheimera sp. UJ63]